MEIREVLAQEFSLKQEQVDAVLSLLEEGNTIPFIARYRKEVTGSLDDEILRKFYDRYTYLLNLEDRRKTILKSIEEQGKLTDELKASIMEAKTLTELEDIYRPYKPKKKTRAIIAKEKGLEPPTSYMDLFDDKYAGLVSLPAMTATAGPYVLGAIAEDLGGSLEDYQAALDLYKEKAGNIGLWYTSDIVPALTSNQVAITVYMDLMLPVLQSSGLNMVWVDAEEGNFIDDVFINVVKDAPNKELAQLFVKYALEKETQEKFVELNNEAPTNKTAEMSEEKDAILVYGQDEFDKCKFFDYDFLNGIKPTLIEEWQKIVA